MSTFQIKLIAILTMLIDHIGLYFFPEVTVLRIIGRLSFPLFAWLIANGAYHTKDIHKYIFRLFVFALISQIPYLLINQMVMPDFFGLNIFFTLVLGLIAIQLIQKTTKKYHWFMISLGISLVGFLFQVDYDAAGVLSVIFFYIYYRHIGKMILAQFLLFFCFYSVPVIEQLYNPSMYVSHTNYVALLQPVAIVSILFISLYTGKQGIKWKYFFYIFYPIHLAIFYLIMMIY